MQATRHTPTWQLPSMAPWDISTDRMGVAPMHMGILQGQGGQQQAAVQRGPLQYKRSRWSVGSQPSQCAVLEDRRHLSSWSRCKWWRCRSEGVKLMLVYCLCAAYVMPGAWLRVCTLLIVQSVILQGMFWCCSLQLRYNCCMPCCCLEHLFHPFSLGTLPCLFVLPLLLFARSPTTGCPRPCLPPHSGW
jgi:hypothetical protein